MSQIEKLMLQLSSLQAELKTKIEQHSLIVSQFVAEYGSVKTISARLEHVSALNAFKIELRCRLIHLYQLKVEQSGKLLVGQLGTLNLLAQKWPTIEDMDYQKYEEIASKKLALTQQIDQARKLVSDLEFRKAKLSTLLDRPSNPDVQQLVDDIKAELKQHQKPIKLQRRSVNYGQDVRDVKIQRVHSALTIVDENTRTGLEGLMASWSLQENDPTEQIKKSMSEIDKKAEQLVVSLTKFEDESDALVKESEKSAMHFRELASAVELISTIKQFLFEIDKHEKDDLAQLKSMLAQVELKSVSKESGNTANWSQCYNELDENKFEKPPVVVNYNEDEIDWGSEDESVNAIQSITSSPGPVARSHLDLINELSGILNEDSLQDSEAMPAIDRIRARIARESLHAARTAVDHQYKAYLKTASDNLKRPAFEKPFTRIQALLK